MRRHTAPIAPGGTDSHADRQNRLPALLQDPQGRRAVRGRQPVPLSPVRPGLRRLAGKDGAGRTESDPARGPAGRAGAAVGGRSWPWAASPCCCCSGPASPWPCTSPSTADFPWSARSTAMPAARPRPTTAVQRLLRPFPIRFGPRLPRRRQHPPHQRPPRQRPPRRRRQTRRPCRRRRLHPPRRRARRPSRGWRRNNRARSTTPSDRGVAYVKKRNGPTAAGSRRCGPRVWRRCPGLTLLECGVPADDEHVRKAADFVRNTAPGQTKTYEIALTILFLDRLGDPKDEEPHPHVGPAPDRRSVGRRRLDLRLPDPVGRRNRPI